MAERVPPGLMPASSLPDRGSTANRNSNPVGTYNPILRMDSKQDTRKDNAMTPGVESFPRPMGKSGPPSRARGR